MTDDAIYIEQYTRSGISLVYLWAGYVSGNVLSFLEEVRVVLQERLMKDVKDLVVAGYYRKPLHNI